MKSPFFILLALVAAACSSAGNEDAARPPANTYTLVFLDKTQSVNPNDSFVNGKYSAALKNLVDNNIRGEGDELEVYFIHENTAKARAMSVRSRTAREDTRGLSPTDLEAASNLYTLSIQRERQAVHSALLQKLMEENRSASNAETDVRAAVQVMATALGNHPRVSAWFFSDMVESRRNGRDFHSRPPQNADQARAWADEDAAAYQDVSLAGADIRVVLPFAPTSSSRVNNPNVTVYWKTFFEALGANSVREE